VIRYRFSDFTLSPQRRVLAREGREVPLIPRYFDLLLLLIERRREAVHRREIFDVLWPDVTVSESALSQAIRTIRRTLGDDSREPRFIRTVSRHGYQFVFPDVVEEEDDGAAPGAARNETSSDAAEPVPSPLEPAVPAAPAAVASGWSGAAAGGALAGIAAGGIGGLLLAAAPGSTAPVALAPVLAVIGGGCGALGGGGVGAGIAIAEARAGERRAMAIVFSAALGGAVVGAAVQWLTRWSLATLVGLDVAVGGGLEGLVIGAAAGIAYATATRGNAGERPSRLGAAGIMALSCGLAGLAITLTGRPLAGGTIHAIADAAHGSRATLAPLGRLIGEPDFGPVSQAILAFGESAVFGLGLAWGLVAPRNRDD
jgi:DNA-binding winged helix-turn-helix (wHTH) protein